MQSLIYFYVFFIYTRMKKEENFVLCSPIIFREFGGSPSLV